MCKRPKRRCRGACKHTDTLHCNPCALFRAASKAHPVVSTRVLPLATKYNVQAVTLSLSENDMNSKHDCATGIDSCSRQEHLPQSPAARLSALLAEPTQCNRAAALAVTRWQPDLCRDDTKHCCRTNTILDYANGAPAFVADAEDSQGLHVIIAQYAHQHLPSALKCKVGSGVAVLCSTHPELPSDWLLPGAKWSNSETCDAAHAQVEDVGHIQQLVKALQGPDGGNDRRRDELMSSLLQHAGIRVRVPIK